MLLPSQSQTSCQRDLSHWWLFLIMINGQHIQFHLQLEPRIHLKFQFWLPAVILSPSGKRVNSSDSWELRQTGSDGGSMLLNLCAQAQLPSTGPLGSRGPDGRVGGSYAGDTTQIERAALRQPLLLQFPLLLLIHCFISNTSVDALM